MRVLSGRNPVKSDTRLGLHNGNCVYARSNLTPRAAKRSRLGVFTIGCPNVPISSLRSSAMMSSTFGRRGDGCWAAAGKAVNSNTVRDEVMPRAWAAEPYTLRAFLRAFISPLFLDWSVGWIHVVDRERADAVNLDERVPLRCRVVR